MSEQYNDISLHRNSNMSGYRLSLKKMRNFDWPIISQDKKCKWRYKMKGPVVWISFNYARVKNFSKYYVVAEFKYKKSLRKKHLTKGIWKLSKEVFSSFHPFLPSPLWLGLPTVCQPYRQFGDLVKGDSEVDTRFWNTNFLTKQSKLVVCPGNVNDFAYCSEEISL